MKNILYATEFLFPIGNFGLTLETPVNKGFIFIKHSDNSIMLTKNNGFFRIRGKWLNVINYFPCTRKDPQTPDIA